MIATMLIFIMNLKRSKFSAANAIHFCLDGGTVGVQNGTKMVTSMAFGVHVDLIQKIK
tara:strand:+ start:353 stop:526 length:174 start_codon:yes stop_codon:yes gene_type:complete